MNNDKQKQCLCSYSYTAKQNNREICNGDGDYTFSTDNKIDFEFVKVLRKTIEKEVRKGLKNITEDASITIVIMNIVCLSNL